MRRISLLSLALLLLVSATQADAARRVKHRPAAQPIVPVTGIISELQGKLSRAALRTAWTQYGPNGALEARAVVDGDTCPDLVVDLKPVVMKKRATKNAAFLTVCWADIPAGTKQAALAFQKSPAPDLTPEGLSAWAEMETGFSAPGPDSSVADRLKWREQVRAAVKYGLVPLPVPVTDPQRILVFGDTGCRIKGKALQDCSNPESWPFARISSEAAKLKPDLVIHVGDYLYRENACPADFKGCQGTPFGDNWPTWDADFFSPAKPLLEAAPWVIVRGNHEDCQRAGPGFLRLLGPTAFDPAAACVDHLAQYSIPFAHLNLAVMDNADAPETSVVEKAVPVYRSEIIALGGEKAPTWWLLHRPIWAPITGPLGIPAGGNLTLSAADGDRGIPSPVELMLAGHIHTFEAINYDPNNHVPPQVVAGFGGDELDPTPADLHGSIFQGDTPVRVKDGISVGGFGFLLMTRNDTGWAIDVYDPHGRIERQCVFAAGRVDCPTPRRH